MPGILYGRGLQPQANSRTVWQAAHHCVSAVAECAKAVYNFISRLWVFAKSQTNY